MGYVSGPGLTSAVSEAGGLGILASATMSPPELRDAIKKVRERTAAPFGVNLRADAADARERLRRLQDEVARRFADERWYSDFPVDIARRLSRARYYDNFVGDAERAGGAVA